jgi:hypothetical protein
MLMMFLNISCVSTYNINDLTFIKWENSDPIYTFDKASKIVGVFIAPNIDHISPTVEFNGKTYKSKRIAAVDEKGIIYKYIVEIEDKVVPGNYDLVATYKKDGIENKSKTQVIVYPSNLMTYKDEDLSEIRVEEGLSAYLNSLLKGDYVEYNAIPSSINNIPSNQFRINISGLSKSQVIHDYIIGYWNNIFVPLQTEKVNLNIVWKNPLDTSISVRLFPSDSNESYVFTPQLKRPRIVPSTRYIIVDSNPRYIILSGDIKPPSYSYHYNESGITDVKFEIQEINVSGYKFEILGSPYSVDGVWQQKFKIVETSKVSKKLEGDIRFRIKAKTVIGNEYSEYSTSTQKIYLQ